MKPVRQDQDPIDQLYAVLHAREAAPSVRRLRIRLAELGEDAKDELIQFRHLIRACREDAELTAAFVEVGLGDLNRFAGANLLDPELGALVQAFNHLIEQRWRNRAMPITALRRRPDPSRPRLIVRINGARELVVRDVLTSDPYCVLTYNDPNYDVEQRLTTDVVKNASGTASWRGEHVFIGITERGTLKVEVWDADKVGEDDPMGSLDIAMADLNADAETHAWFNLQDVESGALRIQMRFEPATT